MKKGQFTLNSHHRLLFFLLGILIVIIAIAIYFFPRQAMTPAETTSVGEIDESLTEKTQVTEFNPASFPNPSQMKAALFVRLNLVNVQPLYPQERQAILAQYGDLSKSDLTDAQKQQIIRALNTR